ncbi:MAG: diguanylate cyclase [Sulfuriferula multivorans]|uniref:diguanylate cyclase n=1 Tax=Sulfuriferula multivorans TaxID=1559896 RepID=A0A7C9TAV9_9PROT|nr:diguanylate cyclase [Sulfuriferula multivorans]
MVDANVAIAAVTAAMAKLRRTYTDRLPVEIAELTALAEGLTGSEAERPKLEALHQRLHKLAGSGGTFGYALLSTHSRSLEHQAQGWLAGSLASAEDESLRDFAVNVAALINTLSEYSSAENVALPAHASMRTDVGMVLQVWLVEDDILLGKELARQLEPFGFEVRLFTRIRDAESAAAEESRQPDILIMDVLFAEESEDSTEVLTARPVLNSLGCPLIFVSSQGGFPSRVRAARLGAEGYFLKPLDVPRLVERLEYVVERRRASPQRVLIVDDDVSLAEHFRLVLCGAGMEVEVLSQLEKIIDRVSGFRPELILMDMHMPKYSGADLAGVIRQHDNWIGLPIVYLSSETNFDKQVLALSHGADDFLTKPIPDAHLIAAVRVRVDRSRQLADQITKDSLTGLLKHASIKEAAEVEVLRSQRSETAVTFAMIDIDHFKTVNDTHGHAVGDLVIKSIATLLRQRLRKSDLIGRYGGEEFLAVLPGCDIEFARQVLEDIRTRFAALQFLNEGQSFNCSLSAGLACSIENPEADSAELIILADRALYAAKRSGRNRIKLSPPEK